jgi:hypothetical protein
VEEAPKLSEAKQLILNFPEETYDAIQERVKAERRSIVGQVEVLLSRLEADSDFVEWFRAREAERVDEAELRRVAVKLPAELYWSVAEWAARAWLTPREAVERVMHLWISGELGEYLDGRGVPESRATRFEKSDRRHGARR